MLNRDKKYRQMKRIIYNLLLFLGMFLIHSCEKDNYEGPDATLQGNIVDASGTPLQLEQGQGTGRIRMDDKSWSDNPIPFYLNFKQDGSYVNNKLFAGTYLATPVEGAFYPVAEAKVEVKGNTNYDFHVIPYLNVEWVKEPEVLPDGKVTATFKFTRNAGPAGEDMPNLLDYQLFISTTQYVGNNNFDGTVVAGVVNTNNEMEHADITITSTVPMKYSTTYWVRVGVRVNDSYKKYNYTTIKTIDVP